MFHHPGAKRFSGVLLCAATPGQGWYCNGSADTDVSRSLKIKGRTVDAHRASLVDSVGTLIRRR